MCAFCNQRTISGKTEIPTAQTVRNICETALSQVRDRENCEIAFFGGSFTAIERGYMVSLLEAAREFLGENGFSGIRVSTRPDCVDQEILSLLKSYGVTAVELGAQSMNDLVLSANERGHTAEDVVRASELIKSFGFELGLQMMVGLYKSTPETDLETSGRIIALKPETVRIYPTVILENTKLGELYKSGEYVPYTLEKAVELCAFMLEGFRKNDIRVIKLGLHASETVEGEMLGGLYHPAFRELCESRLYLEKMKSAIEEKQAGKITKAVFSVPSNKLSQALGQKKSNVKYFESMGIRLEIKGDKSRKDELELLEIY